MRARPLRRGSRRSSCKHQPSLEAEARMKPVRDILPVLDQEIDQLRAVHQSNARKPRLDRCLVSVLLEIGCGDESALAPEGYRLAQLFHRVCADLRPEFVALRLNE